MSFKNWCIVTGVSVVTFCTTVAVCMGMLGLLEAFGQAVGRGMR